MCVLIYLFFKHFCFWFYFVNKNIVLILALLLLFSDYNNLDYVCVCVWYTVQCSRLHHPVSWSISAVSGGGTVCHFVSQLERHSAAEQKGIHPSHRLAHTKPAGCVRRWTEGQACACVWMTRIRWHTSLRNWPCLFFSSYWGQEIILNISFTDAALALQVVYDIRWR